MIIETLIHKFIFGIQNLIFPKMCFSCRKTGTYFCLECLIKLKKPDSFYLPYLDCLIIAGDYNDLCLKKAIRLLKYCGIKDVAQDLAEFLCFRGQTVLSATRRLEKIPESVLTYIPLFPKKERQRGFNQAKLLAENVSKISGIKFIDGLLEKTADRPSQIKFHSKIERQKNIAGSFRVNQEKLRSLGKKDCLKVIIVDDIATTGATLNEAGRVLKKAGIKMVVGLAAAKG